ncbi:MAG: hypothetical protein ACYTE3_11100 [Planctomycetota bacterium]|jgi:hypothetical protein
MRIDPDFREKKQSQLRPFGRKLGALGLRILDSRFRGNDRRAITTPGFDGVQG